VISRRWFRRKGNRCSGSRILGPYILKALAQSGNT
jgi:hypothetical protein